MHLRVLVLFNRRINYSPPEYIDCENPFDKRFPFSYPKIPLIRSFGKKQFCINSSSFNKGQREQKVILFDFENPDSRTCKNQHFRNRFKSTRPATCFVRLLLDLVTSTALPATVILYACISETY